MSYARNATASDNSELHRLAAMEMPGSWLSLSFTPLLDEFERAKFKGENPRFVVVADDDNNHKLHGCGMRCEKNVFWHGKVLKIGYLGDLRSHQQARNKIGLFQGFRLLKKWDEESPVPFYMTTIITGNSVAEQILTSGRAGLPHYHAQGTFRSFAVSEKGLPHQISPELEIVSGSQIDENVIKDFYRQNGAQRDLFPAFGDHLPHGLSNHDFFAIRHKGQWLAMAATIKTEKRQQIRIEKYQTLIRQLRPLINLGCRMLHYPELPQERGILPHRILAYHLVKRNSKAAFEALLCAARERLETELLFWALHKSDPLFEVAMRHPAWYYDCNLYTANWTSTHYEWQNPPHLELAEV